MNDPRMLVLSTLRRVRPLAPVARRLQLLKAGGAEVARLDRIALARAFSGCSS